jgi:predicted nucleotidyltransferase
MSMSSSTPLSLPQFHSPIGEILSSFLQSAKDAFGLDLISVVLFGSAAEGELRATSDLNLILVLASFNQEKADRLREPLRIAQAAIQLHPMFLLKDEISHAARSFAPKFADILRRRVILFGDDPFVSLSIPRDSQVRQLRQQSLNLILRLRASYVARSLREEQLNLVIAGALGPLRSYAADLLALEGRAEGSSSQALATLGAELGVPDWTRTLARLSATQESRVSSPGEAPLLFSLLLDLVCRMHTRAEALSGEVRHESL